MAEATPSSELAALHAPIGEALRLQTQGSLEDARRALYVVVASLERSQPQARTALACALALCADLERECCRIDAAAELYARALALESDGSRAAALRMRAALMLPPLLESSEAIEAARDRYAAGLAELERDPPRLASPETDLRTPHAHLAYHGRDDRELLEQQARVLRLASPELASALPRRALKRPARLRLGCLVSPASDAPTSRVHAGLLAALPHEHFECTLFVPHGAAEAVPRELARCAARIVALPNDLRGARVAIASHSLDVLYLPDVGADALPYLLAFARLARLQVAGCGHPSTTGLDTLDAYVVGSDLEPVGGETHYSEPLVRLSRPNLVCDPPPPARALPRSHFGLREGDTLYVCLQPAVELHPEFDASLSEILSRDTSARLVLARPERDVWATLLRARLTRARVDLSRVHWLRPLPRADLLALLAQADVVLDAFPFGSGHLALEALAAGAPLVTCPTLHARGRVAFSLYRRLGIDDGVARSKRDFVERALRLGRSPAERGALARAIRERSARLFGDVEPARELARALEARLPEGRA